MKLIKVNFRSDVIEVVDNHISVKKLCENLGLVDLNSQYKKIKSDPTFKSEFKEIEINGITQKVLCIPYDKVNGWLFSISVNRVKPEVRQKLIEYKNECFKVLHRYFELKHQNQAQIPNTSTIKELQEVILKQNALIAAKEEQNINQQLQQKMKQQLSLIVSQVRNEILARFEESMDVTSRSLELQQQRKK